MLMNYYAPIFVLSLLFTTQNRTIHMTFGQKITSVRKQKEMSQADVAKLLGVHRSYISQIERGVENMSLKNIERLAKVLRVSVRDLI